ncbi:hypothetical protein VTK56DRAFT_8344 [Thermocarpiscus australiensis]
MKPVLIDGDDEESWFELPDSRKLKLRGLILPDWNSTLTSEFIFGDPWAAFDETTVRSFKIRLPRPFIEARTRNERKSLDAFLQRLAEMKELRELWLASGPEYAFEQPWLMDFANLVAVTCAKLSYVRIFDSAWRITRLTERGLPELLPILEKELEDELPEAFDNRLPSAV